jgi:primosomal protein N' (replication factor Y)
VKLVTVAVEDVSNTPGLFTYVIHEGLTTQELIGSLVEVPFGTALRYGYVLGEQGDNSTEKLDPDRLKTVYRVVLKNAIKPPQLQLAKFVSEKYLCSLGNALKIMVPAYFKRCQRAAISTMATTTRFKPAVQMPCESNEFPDVDHNVFNRVPNVYVLIEPSQDKRLAFYCSLAQKLVNDDKRVLILLPNVYLAQLVYGYLTSLIPEDDVVYISSELTEKALAKCWLDIYNGAFRVVIGTRIAVLMPYETLNMIIMDDEGSDHYVEEHYPQYNARLLALQLANILKANLVFGVFTPSISLYKLIQEQKAAIYKEDQNAELTNVKVVDMWLQRYKGVKQPISQSVAETIDKATKESKKMLLLYNRAGFYRAVVCQSCRKPVMCPSCQIPMRVEQKHDKLICSYCGYSLPWPSECLACGAKSLITRGYGISRVKAFLQALWPNAAVMDIRAPMPADIYDKLDRITGPLLVVSTDVMLKWHLLERFDLVCVLDADIMLYYPHYRSAERVFRRISEVVAWACSSLRDVGLMLQVYNPDHYAVTAAVNRDWRTFGNIESELRRLYAYPPYGILVAAQRNAKRPQAIIDRTVSQLKQQLSDKVRIYASVAKGAKTGSGLAYITVKSIDSHELSNLPLVLGAQWKLDVETRE